MSDFYLDRTLLIDGKTTTEEELISQYKVIIILSEPGAGKTSLLKSLARKLGGAPQRANALIQELTHPQKNCPLVIDALDECSFSHPSDIDKLWKVVKIAQPTQLIIACRGSEWNKSYNQGLKEIFEAESNNHTITIAKITSFSYEEKRKLFTYHYPCLSFDAFYSHLEKTNATNFLDNPQRLILLGKAFSQQQYNFSNKRDIFTFSIQALAKEQFETFPDHHLSLQNKITYAGELFTILLLSNSEGVSNKESVSNAHYPCLKDLLPYEHIQDILNTKLFKIADTENQYIATHKMVAEFCTAEYLSERLISTENPLSLKQLLAILAPNDTIRDDLRGVCAWTACLSHSKNIQETFIHLDPYGVLTYGDPDILLPTSKKILIEQLIQFTDKNPDFIDYQYWNEVHAHNLISKDMENTVNDLLTQSTSFQIRFLVLQLLAKTHVNGNLNLTPR